jgi:hypothetical protein
LPHTGNFAGVFLARSFGFRDLTESLVALVPGFAWSLERSAPRWLKLVGGMGLILVARNLVLVALDTNGMISQDGGASLATLVVKAGAMIANEPLLLVQILEGPILIGLLLSWTTDAKAVAEGVHQGEYSPPCFQSEGSGGP